MSKAMVIISAGMAGGNAAVTMRHEGFRERVVLVGDEPGIPFGRPPLSKTYLRGEEDLSQWLVKPRRVVRRALRMQGLVRDGVTIAPAVLADEHADLRDLGARAAS